MVADVLRHSAKPKVFPAIVHPVAVDMIYDLPRLSIHNPAVKLDYFVVSLALEDVRLGIDPLPLAGRIEPQSGPLNLPVDVEVNNCG